MKERFKEDQFTEDQAIEFYDNELWKEMSYLDRALFQINQERLCMPFGVFHEAVEKSLGKPVFTHEFVTRYDELLADLEKCK